MTFVNLYINCIKYNDSDFLILFDKPLKDK